MKNQKPSKKRSPAGSKKSRTEVMDLDRSVRQEAAAQASTRKKKSKRSGRNREFLIITYLFLILFLAMMAYFIYFQAFKSESFINSSYNARMDLYAQRVIRGDIVSADGEVLAQTETSPDGTESRVYPHGRMFAHAVGYASNGKGGIESQYNFNLLRSHSFFLTQILNDIQDEKNTGDTVVTTLDYDVQKAAYEALGDRDGAVVLLEAKTGKVLAMVSKPDFDPNTLAENWESIVGDETSSVLLNRATSGLYPPGSTFKIFTTLEYVHENPDYENFSYNCEGKISVGGDEIHCSHNSVHGQQTLAQAFANSCNTAYSTIGMTLDIDSFGELCERMLFNGKLPGSVSGKTGRFALSGDDGDWKIMQTAIGQGDTLVSPLQMAIVAAAIANDGVAMKPYLVDHVENDGGIRVRSYRADEYGQMLTASDASLLRDLMAGVVESGTASALSGQSYEAAGKTGSAEYNAEGDSHGWFVGFGSKEGYEDVAVAVIVEGGDSGSKSAVPVAKQIFDVYFNQ